jgi:phage-related protein
VQKEIGVAIFWAQKGDRHSDAKTLRGFGDAHVVEVVENHEGDTYRAVYTTRIAKVIYVLHCFQKKSKKGVKTPAHDIELIRKRLSRVQELNRDIERSKIK